MRSFGVMIRAFAPLLTMLVLAALASGKSSVDIINWSLDQPLWVRCKSKNDDLGWHKLRVKDDYHFEFHTNFWGTTLFWCRFQWGPHGRYWQQFNVWDRSENDLPFPCGKCVWRAEKPGMYIWNKTKMRFDLWIEWRTDEPPPAIAGDIDPDLTQLNVFALNSGSVNPYTEPWNTEPWNTEPWNAAV